MNNVNEFKKRLQNKILAEMNNIRPSLNLQKSLAQLEVLTALTKVILWSEQIYNQMWTEYDKGNYEEWVKRERIAQSN